jgi:hypothetical protein
MQLVPLHFGGIAIAEERGSVHAVGLNICLIQ